MAKDYCAFRYMCVLGKAVLGNFCNLSLPPLLKTDSQAHTAREKADLLGTIFASNSTLDDWNNGVLLLLYCACFMTNGRFLQRPVRKVRNICKSSGPDAVPPIVLRTCAPELAPNAPFPASDVLAVSGVHRRQPLSTRFPKKATAQIRPSTG